MQLSFERFNEIIDQLHTDAASNGDKRRARRVALQFHVRITPILGSSRLVAERARVKDFSPRGLCILFTKPLKAGQQFVLNLTTQNNEQAELLCRAVHCRKARRGVYLIGAEFDCLLNETTQHHCEPNKSDLDRIRESILA